MCKTIAIILLAWIGSLPLAQAQDKGFRFLDHLDRKQIDVTYNGKVLAEYLYFDSLMKPVLFDLHTISGVVVTRGFPLKPREGERMDHPHHIGLWMNYESVDGFDFWNHSTAISFADRKKYGTIRHDGVVRTDSEKNRSTLEVTARWLTPDNRILLRENTTYFFSVSVNDGNFIVDRVTTLTALEKDVPFKDAKDGLLGLRVARELELPSDKPETYVDSHGNPTVMPTIDNKDVSGMYVSSEGLQGDAVWSSRGRWVNLYGAKDGKKVSILIIDHQKNVGYPTFWHARGYGLFAANPLGQEVFSQGKHRLNFVLKKNESTTFRYRIVIHEGPVMSVNDIERLVRAFSKVN
ncbi:MAG: PmoA family protein [Bacteroidota bacterium]